VADSDDEPIDVAREEERRRLLEDEHERYRVVGRSPQIKQMLALVERVAGVPRPVLVTGERGTGKELVARALHDASGARGPFIVVNCAAVADALLESELFGHEKGAFTGAERQTRGKFEQAHGGTLFLDEIGHMSLAFQKKILRTIEYGTLIRVGGSSELAVSTRIVAATNADLQQRIRKSEFLADLYDRLAFEVIRVPPLRERMGDVDVLAQYFLERFMHEVPAFRGKKFSDDALDLLREYAFPGNVRELKNIVERAVYRDTTNEVNPEDIGILGESRVESKRTAFKERIEELEHQLVAEALERAGGNQAQAARLLGLSYHQFRYYHRKHGLES